MNVWLRSLLIVSLPWCSLVTAEGAIRSEAVRFEKETSSTSVAGIIKGNEIVDYQLSAEKGQSIAVGFQPSNPSSYFNVLPPGSERALFIGSVAGNQFESMLPADGMYTIRVYLMRNAARRNESSRYTLDIRMIDVERTTAPSSRTGAKTTGPFHQVVRLRGIGFRVESANEGSINTLRIIPDGLEIDNDPIVRTIQGTVTGAKVADLNVDDSPEIYVYVTSAGSGSYGSVVAYAANRRKSLSEVYLPPVARDEVLSEGYMGHDEFAVVENVLVRRFPIYRATDTNSQPTGGMRQIQYKLVPGEAGWLLEIDKVVEF